MSEIDLKLEILGTGAPLATVKAMYASLLLRSRDEA